MKGQGQRKGQGRRAQARDPPSQHPLARSDHILALRRDGKAGAPAFADHLVERAHTLAASRHVDWRPCLFYAEAIQREAELARSRTKGDAEWRLLYEQELDSLRKGREEAEGILGAYADDLRSLRAQLDEAAAENRSLRVYLDTLRQQLEARHLKTGKSADSSISVPDTYDGLEHWVDKHLAGRLQLHPRAERGLKHARYRDVELVYRALLALAREYRDMRLRSPDDPQPNPRLLEFPLRKGKAKDDELCLAIYFFWDDDKRQVVVGWLPSHLDNWMT